MLHQYTLHRQTDQHWQTDSCRQTNSYLLQSEIYQFRLYHEKGILIKIWKHCFRFNPGIPSGPDFSPKLRNSSFNIFLGRLVMLEMFADLSHTIVSEKF